jgi:hypothetical protein
MYLRALEVQHKSKDAHTWSAKRRIKQAIKSIQIPTSLPSLEQWLPKIALDASTPQADNHDSSISQPTNVPQVLWIPWYSGPKSRLHEKKTLEQCFKEKFGNDSPHEHAALRDAELELSAEEMRTAQQHTQGTHVLCDAYIVRACL